MSWFTQPSQAGFDGKKNGDFVLYWCGLTSALSSLNFYFIAEVILMHG